MDKRNEHSVQIERMAKPILLKKWQSFSKILADFQQQPPDLFVKKHRRLLKKWGEYDLDEEQEFTLGALLLSFGRKHRYIASVDWSGEDERGQVQQGLNKILKKRGARPFDWDQEAFEARVNMQSLRRGEYIPLLLAAMSEQLREQGLAIALLEEGSDQIDFTVLPIDTLEELQHQSTPDDDLSICDTKIYQLFLTGLGSSPMKLMYSLKNTFSVSLQEIKTFCQDLPLVIGQGDILWAQAMKKQYEELGGTLFIEEMT